MFYNLVYKNAQHSQKQTKKPTDIKTITNCTGKEIQIRVSHSLSSRIPKIKAWKTLLQISMLYYQHLSSKTYLFIYSSLLFILSTSLHTIILFIFFIQHYHFCTSTKIFQRSIYSFFNIHIIIYIWIKWPLCELLQSHCCAASICYGPSISTCSRDLSPEPPTYHPTVAQTSPVTYYLV